MEEDPAIILDKESSRLDMASKSGTMNFGS